MKIYIIGINAYGNNTLNVEKKDITKETSKRYYIKEYSKVTGITYVDKEYVDKERYLEYITFDKSKIKEQLYRITNSYIGKKQSEIDYKIRQMVAINNELKDLEYYVDNILEKEV